MPAIGGVTCIETDTKNAVGAGCAGTHAAAKCGRGPAKTPPATHGSPPRVDKPEVGSLLARALGGRNLFALCFCPYLCLGSIKPCHEVLVSIVDFAVGVTRILIKHNLTATWVVLFPHKRVYFNRPRHVGECECSCVDHHALLVSLLSLSLQYLITKKRRSEEIIQREEREALLCVRVIKIALWFLLVPLDIGLSCSDNITFQVPLQVFVF